MKGHEYSAVGLFNAPAVVNPQSYFTSNTLQSSVSTAQQDFELSTFISESTIHRNREIWNKHRKIQPPKVLGVGNTHLYLRLYTTDKTMDKQWEFQPLQTWCWALKQKNDVKLRGQNFLFVSNHILISIRWNLGINTGNFQPRSGLISPSMDHNRNGLLVSI